MHDKNNLAERALKLAFLLFLQIVTVLQLSAQSLVPSEQPNAAQKALIKRGYGMFIHFGVNTFADVEWSDGSVPAEKYNPTQLDPEQWVRTAKEAGFRYVLLITKHHDGFCLWDSKLTAYDVASSPVKTDVVKAVSAACKKYGLQFAVYYSLWDRHEPSYKDKDPQVYINYMLGQLKELFTSYGPICELWLDGGWDRKPQNWGLDQVYKLVKGYNPDCAVSTNITVVQEEGKNDAALPELMTADNKYYMQYFPSDFRLWDPKTASLFDKKQYLYKDKSYYLPFEHTICLSSAWNWFQKSKQLPARSLDELQELFYWCTTNSNSLVINVPPDNTGRIREYEANTVIQLGRKLKIAANQPLPVNGKIISLLRPATASNTYQGSAEYGAAKAVDGGLESRWATADTLAELVIGLDPKATFNKISIFEYKDTRNLPDGFSRARQGRIQEYSVDIMLNGQWQTIYLGTEPMGDCKVIQLPKRYKSNKLRLKILKATAPPSIHELCVIDMP